MRVEEILTCVISLLVIIIIAGLVVMAIGATVVNEQNRIDAGIIVDRRFEAGYTRFSSDKNGGHMHSYPDTYTFTIEGEKNGNIVQFTFEVTEEDYNNYKIGDWYER